MPCQFHRLNGPCPTEVTSGPFCPHHATLTCCSCRAPATRVCDEPGKAKVYGCFLCDGCQHHPLLDGGSGRFYQHAPVGEDLKYPWYAKDVAAMVK